MQKKYQKGQSLVEVVISLSIAIIVMVAFTNATIAAIRNAQYAKNQNTATRIAQKTLELIRVIRDQNNNVGSNPWSNLWGNTGEIGGEGRCYTLNETNLTLAPVSGCNATTDETVEQKFKRRIKLSTTGTCQPTGCPPITVSVRISWTDGKAEHVSHASTQLTNWQ